ncbi:histidine kinase [Aequorivita marina]|uniref:histidine kinase n=1 Tax=Aequorivita marina TaxID=3073654 RepID=UPI00287B9BD4|nr:histidine kinase [Aequorivita sp. S2608]
MNSWKPYDSSFVDEPNVTIWLKFELENKSKDTIQSYFFIKNLSLTTYHQNVEGFKVSKNGARYSRSERSNKSEYNFTQITSLPFQKSFVYISLEKSNNNLGTYYPSLYSQIGYWQFSKHTRESESMSIGFLFIYIIALLTIFMFALVFWLKLRKKLYIYYLGYLFFQLVYGLEVLRATTSTIGNIAEYFPNFSLNFFQSAQFTFIGFYIFFINNLLTVKKYDKLLARILQYLGLFCFAYAISKFVLNNITTQMFEYTLFVIVRSIILPINLILIFWIIIKVKHPLLNYFIIGQSFFFLGAVVATMLGSNLIDHSTTIGQILNFRQAPNVIFEMGLLAEVFCFSLALGQNVLLLQKEKEKTREKLIVQLQENRLLQDEMNRDLDVKVNQKTEELIQLYTELEKERAQKIKDDFTQRIKETEMVALRSQMNPHFIFNSLTAIKYLIMDSRNEYAIDYLDDFSSLLRGILQNSNRKKITVEEELEILELYLSLEKNRMGEELIYDIQCTSKEVLSQYEIPPLLLQPIVENAIWHGLHPSLRAEKKLKIVFDTTDVLKIIIEDNGIGRKESSKKKKLHNAMGVNIVHDRLTLYNHLNDHSIRLNTIDIIEDGKALGTRVTLTYKY